MRSESYQFYKRDATVNTLYLLLRDFSRVVRGAYLSMPHADVTSAPEGNAWLTSRSARLIPGEANWIGPSAYPEATPSRKVEPWRKSNLGLPSDDVANQVTSPCTTFMFCTCPHDFRDSNPYRRKSVLEQRSPLPEVLHSAVLKSKYHIVIRYKMQIRS